MDTYPGRRTAGSGQWVAVGPVVDLLRAQAAQTVVEVLTPTQNVARVRITGVGRPWLSADGETAFAYGYVADADEEDAA